MGPVSAAHAQTTTTIKEVPKESEDCIKKLEAGGEVDDCHKAPSPILPAKNEVIWGVISFVVLAAVLMKFAIPAMQKGMAARTERVRSDLGAAEKAKADALGLIPEGLKGKDLAKSITRAEFAAVAVKTYEALANGAAIPAVNNPFTDCSDVEVLKAYNIGAVNGTSTTTFSPDALLNREQAATMLTRVFKKVSLSGWTLAADSRDHSSN
jgi:hypothetical protein